METMTRFSTRQTTVLVEMHFLPSVHYLAAIRPYRKILLEQWESYNKGSYRNKCMIQSNLGNQQIIVPLLKGKNSLSIREVQISYEVDWLQPIKHRLQTEFGKSPYFEYYIEGLLHIFDRRWLHLFDLNLHLLDYLLEYIDMSPPEFTDRYRKHPDEHIADLRDYINPKYFRSNAHLLQETEVDYFTFVPAHSILEYLFKYGPETDLLVRRYAEKFIR